jgi:hypothetical protein
MTHSLDLSRRGVLRCGTLIFGGATLAALVPTIATAASKESQKAARYQPTPKGKLRCDGCSQWRGPNACVLVDGDISPAGWCILYAPK